VQILVVVVNIQAGTLKAEVEKGFTRTAVDRESIDPKAQINLANGAVSRVKPGNQGRRPLTPKGNRVNIPESLRDNFAVTRNGPADAGRRPGKSSLFFLTGTAAEGLGNALCGEEARPPT